MAENSKLKQVQLGTGTSAVIYDIVDAGARELISAMTGPIKLLVSSSTATTPNATTYNGSAGTLAPTSADFNTIYLVPSTNDTNDIYDEYLAVGNSTSAVWEKIGNTDVNLSNYIQKGTYTNAVSTGITVSDHTVIQGSISGSGKITPAGTISSATGSSIPSGKSVNYTPAGSNQASSVSFGTHTTKTFVQSYPGATSKLNKVSVVPAVDNGTITGISSNTDVSVPVVSTNTDVTATKISSYGTPSSWTFTYDSTNEKLTIGGSNGTAPSGTDVTANKTVFGTATTASKITSATAKSVAKADTAVNVADGTLSSDGAGDTVMTGLGTATTTDAITALGAGTAAAQTFQGTGAYLGFTGSEATVNVTGSTLDVAVNSHTVNETAHKHAVNGATS